MSTIETPAEKPAGPTGYSILTEPQTGETYRRCRSCGREHLTAREILHDDDCPQST